MTKIKKVCIWLPLLLLALWLLFANDIFVFFSDEKIPVEVEWNFQEQDQVYYSVDAFADEGDLFQTFSIYGWAFVPNVEEREDRELYLLLKGSDKCYKVDLWEKPKNDAYENRIVRNDLLVVFRDQLHDPLSGFSSNFSVFPMKNDTYDVYLYCRENDENYGLVNTGRQIVKKGSFCGLKESTQIGAGALAGSEDAGISNRVELSTSRAEKVLFNQSIDVQKVEGDYLYIGGWAFIPEKNTEGQKIYMELTYEDGTSLIFESSTVVRPDVEQAFGSELYRYAGFQTMIPCEDLPENQDFTVDLLIETEDVLYRSKK